MSEPLILGLKTHEAQMNHYIDINIQGHLSIRDSVLHIYYRIDAIRNPPPNATLATMETACCASELYLLFVRVLQNAPVSPFVALVSAFTSLGSLS